MNHKKKHILFILDYYLPHQGGAEKLFSHLIKNLLKQGDSVTIITSKHDITLPSYIKEGKLTIIRKGKTRYSLLFRGVIMGIKTISSTIDLIHTTSYAGALPARIVGKLYKKPITITIHEVFNSLRNDISPKRGGLYKWFEKLISRLSYNTIITVSKYTQDCLHDRYGIDKKKIAVIYNGIDSSFYKENKIKAISMKTPSVLYFGHCGHSKGIDAYINALPQIYNKFPQTSFIFNLLPSKNTNKTIQKLNILSSSIPITLYTGVPKEKLIQLINESSFVVIPSRSEGFGLAAGEVCALGVPLLTTNNGALPEVVSGKYILLDGYTPQSFIKAWRSMINGNFVETEIKQFNRNKCFEQYNIIRNKSIKR